jgi:hypothetical protein
MANPVTWQVQRDKYRIPGPPDHEGTPDNLLPRLGPKITTTRNIPDLFSSVHVARLRMGRLIQMKKIRDVLSGVALLTVAGLRHG